MVKCYNASLVANTFISNRQKPTKNSSEDDQNRKKIKNLIFAKNSQEGRKYTWFHRKTNVKHRIKIIKIFWPSLAKKMRKKWKNNKRQPQWL